MSKKKSQSPVETGETYEMLKSVKAERLQDLLKRKPSEKHYKRSLRSYLEADGAFERAVMDRLSPPGP